jgi:hypothetical protein
MQAVLTRFRALHPSRRVSVFVPFLWVTPSGAHLGLLLLLGAAGAIGHFLLIQALEIERAPPCLRSDTVNCSG